MDGWMEGWKALLVAMPALDLRHCFAGAESFTPPGFLEALERFGSDKRKAEEHLKSLCCRLRLVGCIRLQAARSAFGIPF